MMINMRLFLAIALLTLAGCGMTQQTDPATQNASTPGWTGRTVVIGANSTVAGDARATYEQQKWQLNGRR